MLPDDSVNMKFLIGKLEPHCFAISFTLLAFLKLVFVLGLYCIYSGFIMTTLELLFNCSLA